MKLCKLTVEGYKAFDKPTTLNLRPITILVGSNNSGKSVLARSIPLLAGSLLANGSGDRSTIPLESLGLNHGQFFEDLISHHRVHGNLKLAATFLNGDKTIDFEINIQNVISPQIPSYQVVNSWILNVKGSRHLILTRKTLDDDSYKVQNNALPYHTTRVSWNGLCPSIPDSLDTNEWIRKIFISMQDWARGIRYLKCPRVLPHYQPNISQSSFGINGEGALQLLYNSEEILNRIKEFYRNAFNTEFNLYRYGATLFNNLQRKGQGLSQVLPVAILSLSSSTSCCGVDIIEHPEAGLDSGAHVRIADLFLQNLAGSQRPLIIETHSENLLLRIRRRVAEREISPKDIAIYWINKEYDGSSTLDSVQLNQNGEIDNWPDGAFDTAYHEVCAIRNAARKFERSEDEK